MSHYRRITRGEFNELQSKFSETVVVDGEEQTFTPSEYDTFATFHAVIVGKDGSGAYLVHVNREDSDELPGTHVGDSIEDLKGAARKAIARSRISRKVTRGSLEEVVPEGDVPDGAEILETGLAPHTFAGH